MFLKYKDYFRIFKYYLNLKMGMMKYLIRLFVLALLVLSCKSGGEKDKKDNQGIHEAVVKEVLDAGGYSYLKVDEKGEEKWLAVNQMDAKVGETYYYNEGMTMTDFESESLGKTFESIIFLDEISKNKEDLSGKTDMKDEKDMMAQHHAVNLKSSQEKIEVEPAEGGITIAELYANKKKYKGKKIIVRGKVTKFNEAIMNTNWIHIQDGTEHEGSFDLTAKSDAVVKIGDVVTLEGKVNLDVDLGHGYSYDIILKDAVLR